MSTGNKTKLKGRGRTLNRFAKLAALGETVLHTRDLAVLWDISDANTLHTTLKRYTRQGLLHRLWRGMYAVKPADRIDLFFLGVKALHGYAYVGFETILFQAGVMNQRPTAITLASRVSRRFVLAGQSYVSRKLADRYLYQMAGIREENGVKVASVERAVADVLYVNPRAFFDGPIDWPEVRRIQEAVGYPVIYNR